MVSRPTLVTSTSKNAVLHLDMSSHTFCQRGTLVSLLPDACTSVSRSFSATLSRKCYDLRRRSRYVIVCKARSKYLCPIRAVDLVTRNKSESPNCSSSFQMLKRTKKHRLCLQILHQSGLLAVPLLTQRLPSLLMPLSIGKDMQRILQHRGAERMLCLEW